MGNRVDFIRTYMGYNITPFTTIGSGPTKYLYESTCPPGGIS